MNYIYKLNSPVGGLSVASDGVHVTGLWMDGQKYFAAGLGEVREEALPVFQQVSAWLDCYFAGREPDFSLPLAPAGSEFRQNVWNLLKEIPYGQVTTYGDLARQIAKRSGKERMSAQAVGGAVGHNPLSIIIPCHRVVGTSGSLTGYAGGISLKIKLLELEHVNMDRFYVPRKGTAL